MKEIFDIIDDAAFCIALLFVVSMAWITYEIRNAPYEPDDEPDNGYDLTKSDSD